MPYFRNQTILIILLFFILCEPGLLCQESQVFQNYYTNFFIINPAATGSDYYPQADLSVRRQWAGFPDAPSTFMLSGNARAGRKGFYDNRKFLNRNPLKMTGRVGLGASVFMDINGPLIYGGGIISYAYHLPVNSRANLSLGVSAIAGYYALNTSLLRPDQPDDPYLLAGDNHQFSANINLGILFRHEDFFTGLSVCKILPDYLSLHEEKRSEPSIFLTGGTTIKLSGNLLMLEPAVVIKKVGGENPAIDFHTKLFVKKLHWIAISYSTAGKINFRLGLRMYKKLFAGYGYEYTMGDVASYNSGSHEIHIGINLGLTGMDKDRYDKY